MRYMLDTNICIFAIKKRPEGVLAHLKSHTPEEICISSVTYGELCHGVEKSQDVMRNRLALTMFLSLLITYTLSLDFTRVRQSPRRP